MRLEAAFVVGFAGFLLVACGGGGTSSTYQDPKSETNGTEPSGASGSATQTTGAAVDENGNSQGESGPPSVLTASPSCATPGSRVVLKLGLTRDHRTPDCYKVDDARVEFASGKHAKVTLIGPTSDGFCALDVEVPEEAESGKVKVEIGKDDFESEVVFDVPCP